MPELPTAYDAAAWPLFTELTPVTGFGAPTKGVIANNPSYNDHKWFGVFGQKGTFDKVTNKGFSFLDTDEGDNTKCATNFKYIAVNLVPKTTTFDQKSDSFQLKFAKSKSEVSRDFTRPSVPSVPDAPLSAPEKYEQSGAAFLTATVASAATLAAMTLF